REPAKNGKIVAKFCKLTEVKGRGILLALIFRKKVPRKNAQVVGDEQHPFCLVGGSSFRSAFHPR
ncbi:MAG: hypothetical protein CMM02_08905, partial [Rhodopirellula sp.]|nr:hypothetical protein [Rhodopirellula sp.]